MCAAFSETLMLIKLVGVEIKRKFNLYFFIFISFSQPYGSRTCSFFHLKYHKLEKFILFFNQFIGL